MIDCAACKEAPRTDGRRRAAVVGVRSASLMVEESASFTAASGPDPGGERVFPFDDEGGETAAASFVIAARIRSATSPVAKEEDVASWPSMLPDGNTEVATVSSATPVPSVTSKAASGLVSRVTVEGAVMTESPSPSNNGSSSNFGTADAGGSTTLGPGVGLGAADVSARSVLVAVDGLFNGSQTKIRRRI